MAFPVNSSRAAPRPQVNEYEQQRLENIARNRQRMMELDLMGASASVGAPCPSPPCSLHTLLRNHPRFMPNVRAGRRLHHAGDAMDCYPLHHNG